MPVGLGEHQRDGDEVGGDDRARRDGGVAGDLPADDAERGDAEQRELERAHAADAAAQREHEDRAARDHLPDRERRGSRSPRSPTATRARRARASSRSSRSRAAASSCRAGCRAGRARWRRAAGSPRVRRRQPASRLIVGGACRGATRQSSGSRPRALGGKNWFQKSRSWSGGSKRAGVDPGSKIRLEPFREPGSAPAKPLGSLTASDDWLP